MGAHFASTQRQQRRRERRHQVAALGVALGVGLLGFTFVDGDGRTSQGVPRSLPASTAPTVLGVTIERDDVAPAASPATFEDTGIGRSTTRPPRTATTTATSPTTARPSTTTTGPAELIPPVVVESTSTTVDTATTAETTSTTTATTDTTP